MPNNLRIPISRNNMFYSEEDFEYETDLLMGYMEEDVNQTIILYEVDHSKTNVDAVYKETKNNGVRFKAPKEIPCLYEIKDSETKAYDGKTSNGIYTVSGSLTVYMMPKILEKYRCDIKRGDYIGIMVETGRIVYYSVVNDGRVNTANELHVGAYKPAWRVITGAIVDQSEFNGK